MSSLHDARAAPLAPGIQERRRTATATRTRARARGCRDIPISPGDPGRPTAAGSPSSFVLHARGGTAIGWKLALFLKPTGARPEGSADAQSPGGLMDMIRNFSR